jgi:hypothetical protein
MPPTPICDKPDDTQILSHTVEQHKLAVSLYPSASHYVIDSAYQKLIAAYEIERKEFTSRISDLESENKFLRRILLFVMAMSSLLTAARLILEILVPS